MPTPIIIELWPSEANCCVCDARIVHDRGLAIYEDVIVPDDHNGEWGGAPACERCYHIARSLQSEHPGKAVPFSTVLRIAQGGNE